MDFEIKIGVLELRRKDPQCWFYSHVCIILFLLVSVFSSLSLSVHVHGEWGMENEVIDVVIKSGIRSRSNSLSPLSTQLHFSLSIYHLPPRGLNEAHVILPV